MDFPRIIWMSEKNQKLKQTKVEVLYLILLRKENIILFSVNLKSQMNIQY